MTYRLRGHNWTRCGALIPWAPTSIAARLASNLDYDPE